jgi:DNA-binding response OmpR family regulator
MRGEPVCQHPLGRMIPAMPGKDILIVDGELGYRELLGGALRDAGYAVEVAESAAEARKLLHGCQYRMVLVNWRLPDGDGSAIASVAATSGSRVFVMSGYLRQIDPGQTLMKPVGPAEVLAAARACIGKAPGTG